MSLIICILHIILLGQLNKEFWSENLQPLDKFG